MRRSAAWQEIISLEVLLGKGAACRSSSAPAPLLCPQLWHRVCPELSLCVVSAGGSTSLSPVLQEGLWHCRLLFLNQSPAWLSLGLGGPSCDRPGAQGVPCAAVLGQGLSV